MANPRKFQFMICTSNDIFQREIWDKFTEFTFLKIRISTICKFHNSYTTIIIVTYCNCYYNNNN